MNKTNSDWLKAVAKEGDINLLYRLIQEDPQVLEHEDSIRFAETPLHIAASLGHLQFATEIMRLKPSFAWKLNQQVFSPIHLAMQKGQKRMVLRFVDINKDLVRVKGREGLTPLHFLSQTGEIDLLASFLSACPDSIEDVTVRGETALHIAVKNKQYEALEVLVGWLKRTRQRGAMQLEKIILNWKDEEGNTVLHISTLMNDSKALSFLVKTKIDLKAKNLEKSTALDIAESAEIKSILFSAGAKPGSKFKDASTREDTLRSKMTIMDKILIFVLRIRRDISEEERNAFLIVAALIATATFQSALNPPGGFYQANAVDNNNNNNNNNVNTTSSLNSTATATSQGNAGKSVMPEGDFFTLSIFNTLSLLVSTITIFILTPSGIVGSILFQPMFWFAYCYLYSMKLISPTSATLIFNSIMLYFFNFLYSGVYFSFAIGYKRLHAKNRGIKTKNSTTGGNKW